MIIDVLINGCARPDVLEVSVSTFRKRITSNKHEFRYVMIEDKVDNEERQKEGERWIEDNIHLFDEVVFFDKKAGPGYWFAPTVLKCKSDYFIHLEDDNEFLIDVNVDDIIDFLKTNDDVVEVMLSRGPINPVNDLGLCVIDGIKLTNYRLLSVATGIFNTNLVRNIIDRAGWDAQLHENGTLTPISEQLEYRKFVLGHGTKHYAHTGAEKGYKKGRWIK